MSRPFKITALALAYLLAVAAFSPVIFLAGVIFAYNPIGADRGGVTIVTILLGSLIVYGLAFTFVNKIYRDTVLQILMTLIALLATIYVYLLGTHDVVAMKTLDLFLAGFDIAW